MPRAHALTPSRCRRGDSCIHSAGFSFDIAPEQLQPSVQLLSSTAPDGTSAKELAAVEQPDRVSRALPNAVRNGDDTCRMAIHRDVHRCLAIGGERLDPLH